MASAPSPALVSKLKEGINEAIVFLRMLEASCKLSAVVERRRKGLLDQLLDLVGDTMREAPPSYEPKDDSAGSVETGGGGRGTRPNSGNKSDSTVTSPEKTVAKQPEQSKVQDNKPTFEKTSSLDKKNESAPSTSSDKQPATLSDKRQLEKAASADKKQPEKTATLDKKQAEKEPQEGGVDHLQAPTTPSGNKLSPLFGRKNKKSTETANTDQGKEESASNSGESQTRKKSVSEKTSTTLESQDSSEVPTDAQAPTATVEDSATHDSTGKKKKGMFGGMKSIFSGKKQRDRDSLAPSSAVELSASREDVSDPPPDTQKAAETAQCADYSNPVELVSGACAEPQGKMRAQLEKQVKGKFGTSSWTKHQVILRDDSIIIDSRVMPLAGCHVMEKGPTLFKLTLSSTSEHFVLRTESEDTCRQWVSALEDTIKACTPVQETPAVQEQKEEAAYEEPTKTRNSSAVPWISVTSDNPNEEGGGGGGGGEPLYKNISIKGSEDSLKKHLEMPDQRVATMKGVVYRKTNWLNWDKRWGLLTSEPCLYLSQSETSSECVAKLPLEAGKFEQLKKGHDKSYAAFEVKSGKSKETFSVPQGEMAEWKSALEVALGISGDLELASSDEDVPEEEAETYEDMGERAPPPIPSGPRPTSGRVSLAVSEPDDRGGEDIYEECDEAPRGPPPAAAPSLPPPRAAQKDPSPTLPLRKEAGVAPAALPPKSSPSSLPASNVPTRPKPPTTTVAAKVPHPPTKSAPPQEDEELYDDVVQPTGDDDLYEDTADMSGAQPQQDEYVAVDINAEEGEEYVPVEMGGEEEYIPVDVGGEEEYEDVASEPPPPTTTNTKGATTSTPARPALPLPARDPPKPSASIPSRPPPPPSMSSNPAASSPHKSPVAGPKVTPAAVKNKVSSLSVMFEGNKKNGGGGGGSSGGGCSGQAMHQGPKGGAYKEEWLMLEQSLLGVQKTSADKWPHTQLALQDHDLTTGGCDPEGGAFSFKLTKGDVAHSFSLKSQDELDRWMLAVRPLVKRVILMEPKCIYEVMEDHTPTEGGGGYLTLKKGMFVQILKDKSPTLWIGQCGKYDNIFEGPIGVLPSSKVSPISADDVYM